METFRHLGVADKVRAAGLPDDYPTDAVFTGGFGGTEITRIKLPSRNERMQSNGRSAPGFLDSNWLTPEPVVRLSQYFLNPILYKYAKISPNISLMPQVIFRKYETTECGVHVTGDSIADGKSIELEASYLVGCDGARSMVRKQMGVNLIGDDQLGRTRSTLVRCPQIRDLYEGRPAWMNWIYNSKVSGVCIAIDGKELWLLHRNVPAEAPDFDALDADDSIRDLVGVADLQWEVIQHVDWTARRLVAERFRVGYVFIEGDAAHIWLPMAGYGMNAGIADAMNLSWMMAAVLLGHASPSILDAHEKERHPITEQVSRLAMAKALEYASRNTEKDVPREEVAKIVYEINAPQFVCEGLNFGYFYDDSRLILYDTEIPPRYDMGSATPSTAPGCRLPHFWLSAKDSIYDLLGPYYSLLQLNGCKMDSLFKYAFDVGRMPLTVIDAEAEASYFRHDFLLVRADQHICWRGNALPDDMTAVVEKLTHRSG